MGRRIYDENGNFVWKYTFGRQSSEMRAYAEEYGIGTYSTHGRDNSDEYAPGSEDYYEWTEYTWEFEPSVAVKKLKVLLKKLCNGHTVKELEAIGMKGVHDFVSKQSTAWKKHYKDDLEWVKKAKSSRDFQYFGSGGQGYNFEVYDIYAKAIEAKITCSADFLEMTKRFIKHIQKYKTTTFFDEY